MDYIKVLNKISKYTNTLFNDGSMYWSGDEKLKTEDRKKMVIDDIALIESEIEILKTALNNTGNK